MNITDDTIIYCSKNIIRLLGKTSTVIYNPIHLKLAKITIETEKLLNFLSIPRSFATIKKIFLQTTNKDTNEKSLSELIVNLAYSGFISVESITQPDPILWKPVSFKKNNLKLAAVHVTYKCNLKCDYCYNKEYRSEYEESYLTTNQWRTVFFKLLDYGVNCFDITGGEPMIRQDLLSVYQDLKRAGAEIVMITNGTLINSDLIAKKLRKSITRVVLSIDSFNPNEHDFHRGKGSHRKVIEAANYLTNNEINWSARMVFNADNYNSFKKTREYVIKLGAKGFGASLEYLSEKDNKRLNKTLIAKELGNLYSLDYSLHDDEVVKNPKRTSHKKPLNQITSCPAARTECAIDPQGYVYPCRVLMSSEFRSKKSVFEDSFKNIWESSVSLEKIRKFDPNQINECKNCDFFNLCLGGCRGIAYLRTGKLYGFVGPDICRHIKISKVNRLLDRVNE